MNNTQASSAKAVTVNSSVFNQTLAVNAVPLSVLSKGNITLNHVQAEQNLTTQETILLDNCFIDLTTPPPTSAKAAARSAS